MKARKLKRFILPSIYILIIAVSFISITVINKYINNMDNDYEFTKSIMKEEVIVEHNETNLTTFVKPYISESITITKNYYDMDDTSENQVNALFNYENTYMPSTGCMYSSDIVFDVVSVYPGTVTKIKKDEVLGNVIEITHNSNLITYYYSVDNITIKENAVITAGTKIGESSVNKLTDNANNLYFEVYYQGKSIDPEVFYSLNPNEMA